jgi:peptidoglycan-associated lipoprotein
VPAARPIPELSDIFFDFDRFVIRDDARSRLEANAGLLKSQSAVKILIEGHCDERGTSAYNLVLGERRAQATAQYLKDLGVPSSQIEITSYGKERPFCAEHSEACWQSNRRAHFTR